MFKTTLFVVFATCTLFGVNAIKCYSCDTAATAKCEDPDKDDGLSVECTTATLSNEVKNIIGQNDTLYRAEEFLCYNAKSSAGDISVIVRGCVPSSIADGYCKAAEALLELAGGKMNYCGTCNSDLCNSAKGLHIHLFTSIACLFAALLVSML